MLFGLLGFRGFGCSGCRALTGLGFRVQSLQGLTEHVHMGPLSSVHTSTGGRVLTSKILDHA